MNKDYCVCIRTLGTAGEKYQTMLDSLKRQTIQPQKILVYIPHGYELPKETIGIEQYVRCEKGMVHQRSQPFDEVDTEWMLFLDDDVYLADNSVEMLFEGLEKENGDAISADVFRVQNLTWYGKLIAAQCFTFPRINDGWAFKLWRSGSYTYNLHPTKTVLKSQSAGGPTLLVRLSSFKAVHFEDERWMDTSRYPIGEDMMLAYKLYLYGYKLLIHYDCGAIHLDARSARVNNPSERYLLTQTVWFILWYRVFFNLKNATWKSKLLALTSYSIRECWSFIFGAIPRSLKYRNFDSIWFFFKKYKNGYDYVHSEEYKKIPYYDEYK